MVMVFNAVKLVLQSPREMRYNFTYLHTFVINITVMKM